MKDNGLVENSIMNSAKSKSTVEQVMKTIFVICGFVAVVGVLMISLYMIITGAPAIAEVGVFEFLFGQVWYPESSEFGILAMILSSLCATIGAVLIAAPIGVAVAVFLAKLAPTKLANAIRPIIELMSGIPSVIYGLLGAILIAPMVFDLQTAMGLPQSGSLLAAIVVLVIMILPSIISISENAIRSIPKSYYESSLALGATKMQTIMKVLIPAAKNGIAAGLVLGTGRAIGETMAVMMVAGNAAVMPELLGPVRVLTVGITNEWAYSSGIHREALYGISLVLFIFIMIINIVLNRVLKNGGKKSGQQ